MKIALISDIHGNLPALEQVLASIDKIGVDEIWCLGDILGYGAHPDECAELVAERCSIVLAGNHDLVIRGSIPIAEFSEAAATAATWTASRLSDHTRKYIDTLSPYHPHPDFGLFHASPLDPVWQYVVSTGRAADCLRNQTSRVSLIGHSHMALYFSKIGPETTGNAAEADEVISFAEGKWLMNPGSVGQPRDRDTRASFLLLDPETSTARYKRVEYSIDEAAQAILDAGLPAQLAQRLYIGQ